MELSLFKVPGQESVAASNITVNSEVFGQEYKEPLIHQVVTAYQAHARSGSHAQKSRSEVSGGGVKPWKQKGTGRARAGTSRSPIWRKGGVTFAAKPTSYAQKVNKKMYKGAMCSILSELYRQGRLLIVDDFEMASHKTKDLMIKLSSMGLDGALIVSETVDTNIYLAARNNHKVEVCDSSAVDPLSLVAFEKVVVTVPALRRIEEILG